MACSARSTVTVTTATEVLEALGVTIGEVVLDVAVLLPQAAAAAATATRATPTSVTSNRRPGGRAGELVGVSLDCRSPRGILNLRIMPSLLVTRHPGAGLRRRSLASAGIVLGRPRHSTGFRACAEPPRSDAHLRCPAAADSVTLTVEAGAEQRHLVRCRSMMVSQRGPRGDAGRAVAGRTTDGPAAV
jgi:hypothetical protein